VFGFGDQILVQRARSIFEEMMQIVVRSSLAANQDIVRLQEEGKRKLRRSTRS
jgi:hypothetical protein